MKICAELVEKRKQVLKEVGEINVPRNDLLIQQAAIGKFLSAKNKYMKSKQPVKPAPEVIVSKRGLNYLLAASKNPVFDIKRNQVLTETDEGYLDYLIEIETNLQRELDLQEERERRLQAELAFLECENSSDSEEQDLMQRESRLMEVEDINNEVVIEMIVPPTNTEELGAKPTKTNCKTSSAKKDPE